MRTIIAVASLFLVTFSTLAQVTLLEENFDTQGLPVDWERIDNDGNTPAADVNEYTEAWIYKEDPLNTGNGTFSSTSYFDPIDRADRWLITPSVTLGASGNFISWKGLSADPSFPDSYKVVISKTDTDIASFTDTLVIISDETADWTKHEYSLEEYANETVHFAFVNTTFDGFKLYLDSVYVREQDPLNVSNESKINVSVYPNPVIEVLNVQADALIKEATIFNVLGECVKTILPEGSTTINENIANLNEGVYQVNIVLSDGNVVRQKIIKK